MGSLFFFISLAVLVGIVGLLAYYFKSRLAEVENKNMKSLEIIEGMYSQQQQMKQIILGGHTRQQYNQEPIPDQSQYDERIKIVLEEEEDEDEDDEDDEDDDEDEDDDSSDEEEEIKKITVDMSFPEECDINIDEDEQEYIPEDEPEVNIDEQLNNIDEIIVSKLEEECKSNKPDEEFEITAVKLEDKDTYKKMSTTALKNILHSRGIVTDNTRLNKMKKTEIIDLLLVASLAQ